MTPHGTTRLFRTALSTLYYSRVHTVARSFTRGVGQILMLHHVRPEAPDAESDVGPADTGPPAYRLANDRRKAAREPVVVGECRLRGLASTT